MSWNPLRKITLMHRPDFDPSTQNANEALEKLVAEFDSAENVTKSLHQAAKKLPDHILCTGKYETKMTDDISSSNIFEEDESMRNIMEEWHSFAFLTNAIGDEYVISIQKTIIEPLKQLKQAFADLRAAIKLHDSVQLDVIKLKRKVANFNEKEKTGPNLVKLQEVKQQLANSQSEFAQRTQILVNDLSKFLVGSIEMLKPLLEAFIAAEVAWIRACKKTMDNKTQITSATTLTTGSDRLKSIEAAFRSMSTLSICSDSK